MLQKKQLLEQNVNVYIVCDLDAWPRNTTNNFKFKNCLFGASNRVKNSDKEKYLYSGYKILDSAQSVTKIMGKTAIRTISCFYSLPPLTNVEKE